MNLTDGIKIMVANDDQKQQQQQQQKFMKTPSAAAGFVSLQMDGFHLTLWWEVSCVSEFSFNFLLNT